MNQSNSGKTMLSLLKISSAIRLIISSVKIINITKILYKAWFFSFKFWYWVMVRNHVQEIMWEYGYRCVAETLSPICISSKYLYIVLQCQVIGGIPEIS